MARRQVSLLITNNYSSRSYRATLSLTAVRMLAVVAMLVAALFVVALLVARTGLYRSARLPYLELRNRQIEEEFAKVTELRQRLGRLEEMERRYAEMLGVGLTPPPVDWDEAVVDTLDDREPDRDDTWGGFPIPTLIPLDEFVLSRRFGRNHPGVDLAARTGSPVRAAADGVVTARGSDSIFGNYLLLAHLEGFETYYAHLHEWQSEHGDSVRAGQTIATVGSTGRSSAPHLHYEIRRHGRSVNPATLLDLR